MGADAGKVSLLNTACMAHGTLQAIGSVIGKYAKSWGFNLGSARRICFTRKGMKFQE